MLLLSLTTSAVDFEFAYQACSVIKTASGNETRLPWDQKPPWGAKGVWYAVYLIRLLAKLAVPLGKYPAMLWFNLLPFYTLHDTHM